MKVEKLTVPGCYRARNIENNDKILIGGSNLFSRELNLVVTADIENFERLFKSVETNARNFAKNKDWMEALHKRSLRRCDEGRGRRRHQRGSPQ